MAGILTNGHMIVFGDGGVGVAVEYENFERDGGAMLTEGKEEWVLDGREMEAGIMGDSCRMVTRCWLKGMRGG